MMFCNESRVGSVWKLELGVFKVVFFCIPDPSYENVLGASHCGLSERDLRGIVRTGRGEVALGALVSDELLNTAGLTLGGPFTDPLRGFLCALLCFRG